MATADYAGNAANTLLGANQLLPQGTHRGANVTASSNKVQPGRLASQGPSHRAPTAPTQARPLGLIQND
jgi:hypothetical protein